VFDSSAIAMASSPEFETEVDGRQGGQRQNRLRDVRGLVEWRPAEQLEHPGGDAQRQRRLRALNSSRLMPYPRRQARAVLSIASASIAGRRAEEHCGRDEERVGCGARRVDARDLDRTDPGDQPQCRKHRRAQRRRVTTIE